MFDVVDFEMPGAVELGVFENGSAEWHEARKGAVGGSQVGAIIGVNPWESAVTAFYKFTGQIESEVTPSMSMRLGTKLEDDILEIFAEEHPELTVLQAGSYASKKESRFHANPDGIFVELDGTVGVVEIKFSRDYWSEVPRHYRAQVIWYMHVLGLKKAKIVALAGSTYQEFELDYDPFEASVIEAQVYEFLDCVDRLEQPMWDGSESTLNTMRDLNKGLDDVVEDLGDLGMHYCLAYERLQDVTEEYRELQSRVLDALGSAKYGEVEGERVVAKQQSRSGSPFLVYKRKVAK